MSSQLKAANTITIKPGDAPGGAGAAGGGRGHNQKGSGNVIVAKPNIVTADGITLRAHERLPTQLLLEMCQREKRPLPAYRAKGPGLRHSVWLADKKDTNKDLSWLPASTDFESVKVAKDFAALLALFDLQRTLPLDNKLPEPYCSTWRGMIAAHKEQEKEDKANR